MTTPPFADPGRLIAVAAEPSGELWARFEHLWTWVDVALFWETTHPGADVPLDQPVIDSTCHLLRWPDGTWLDAGALCAPPGHSTLAGVVKAASAQPGGWYRPLIASRRLPAHSQETEPGAALAERLHLSASDLARLASAYPVPPDDLYRRLLDLVELLNQSRVSAHAYLTAPWPYGWRSARHDLATPLEAIRHGQLAFVERVALPMPALPAGDRRCRYVLLGARAAELLLDPERPRPRHGVLYGVTDASGTTLLVTRAAVGGPLLARGTPIDAGLPVGGWADEAATSRASSGNTRDDSLGVFITVGDAPDCPDLRLHLPGPGLHPDAALITAPASAASKRRTSRAPRSPKAG